MTDRELLDLYIQNKSVATFEELVARHSPSVYGSCLRLLKDAHAAEDATQAAFFLLAEKAATIPKQATVAGWLYLTARHCASTIRRSVIRRQHHEQEAGAMKAERHAAEDAGTLWKELSPLIDEAMSRLPAPQRDAIILHFFYDLTLESAANEVGCPTETLRSRVNLGLKRLRSSLSRGGAELTLTQLSGVLAVSASETAPAGLRPALVSTSLRTTPLSPQALIATSSFKSQAVGYATVGTAGKLTAAVVVSGALLTAAIVARPAAPAATPATPPQNIVLAPPAPTVARTPADSPPLPGAEFLATDAPHNVRYTVGRSLLWDDFSKDLALWSAVNLEAQRERVQGTQKWRLRLTTPPGRAGSVTAVLPELPRHVRLEMMQQRGPALNIRIACQQVTPALSPETWPVTLDPAAPCLVRVEIHHFKDQQGAGWILERKWVNDQPASERRYYGRPVAMVHLERFSGEAELLSIRVQELLPEAQAGRDLLKR